MQFIRTENLRAGMRLARPIYNKQGVLLFERDSKLTSQGIASVANFGLIGLFILEPAEPVPPMTKEDIEFERFQTMTVFALEEEIKHILAVKKATKMQIIANNVIRNYGHLEKKINFIQNLRSKEDYIFKHSLNTAILCTMMTHVLNVKLDEQLHTVLAALSHDIGKLSVPQELLDAGPELPEVRDTLRRAEVGAYDLIETLFLDGVTVRRICSQSQKALGDLMEGKTSTHKMVTGAKILAVADAYDAMTAMRLEGTPISEVAALKRLMDNPGIFDPEVVLALVKSVHILSAGISVELNTGEKALVLKENSKNVLRPIVLSFQDNSVIDLSDGIYTDIQIVDIMKTMDNRYIMNTEAMKMAGISVDEEEYI